MNARHLPLTDGEDCNEAVLVCLNQHTASGLVRLPARETGLQDVHLTIRFPGRDAADRIWILDHIGSNDRPRNRAVRPVIIVKIEERVGQRSAIEMLCIRRTCLPEQRLHTVESRCLDDNPMLIRHIRGEETPFLVNLPGSLRKRITRRRDNRIILRACKRPGLIRILQSS